MAHTLVQAAKLSQKPMARGIMKAIVTSNETFAKMRFANKGEDSFQYNREKALASTEFVDPAHTSLTESSSTFDQVTVPFRLMVSNVDVYNFPRVAQSGANDQVKIQLEKKAKSAGRTIADKAINGGHVTGGTFATSNSVGTAAVFSAASAHTDSDRYGPGSVKYTHTGTLWQYRAPGDISYGPTVAVAGDATVTLVSDNPNKTLTLTITVASATANDESNISFTTSTNEPDGLYKLMDSSQEIASTGTDGDAFSLATLDALMDLVKEREDLAFMCNSAILRKYYAAIRALGGTDPQHTTVPGISAPVPTYRGVPILKNDWMLSNEAKGAATTLSSICLVNWAAEEGFWAGVAGTQQTMVEGDPRDTSVLGLALEPVGTLEDKDAQRWRIKWYGAYALGSTLSAARAKEIVTA